MDDDLRAVGPARKAANKNDFQLKIREPWTISLGKGDTTAFPGGEGVAENATVSHLKQLCHKKRRRETGLKAEDGNFYV